MYVHMYMHACIHACILTYMHTYIISLLIKFIAGGGVNYFSGPYLVAFPAGRTTAAITIQINDDAVYENRSLHFNLTIASDRLADGVFIGNVSHATVTIIDDECELYILYE